MTEHLEAGMQAIVPLSPKLPEKTSAGFPAPEQPEESAELFWLLRMPG